MREETILGPVAKYPDFDRTPFIQAREDIRDLATMPVQAYLMIPPARRRDEHLTSLMTIPLDLAAAGFAVSVTQDDKGWHVGVKKTIAPRSSLHLLGQSRSYVSALFQLADSADLGLRDLEKKARNRHESPQGSEVAA